MKRILFVVAITLIASGLVLSQRQHDGSSNPGTCEMYPTLLDSLYTFDKDLSTGEWKLGAVRLYESINGRHSRLTFINATDRKPVRSSEFFYDANGNRKLEVQNFWGNNMWNDYIRIGSEFDENNRKLNESRTIYRNGAWTFYAYYYFEYASDGKLSKLYYQAPNENGVLYNKTISEYYYENNLVSELRILNTDGSVYEVNQYIYNEQNKISELKILVPGNNNQLIEFRRRYYIYDEYFILKEVMFEEFRNGEWIQLSSYTYFYPLDKAKRIYVCHNNESLCIPVSQLQKHLEHGDKPGVCPVLNQNLNVPNIVLPSIFIYPNPAGEKVTVKLNISNNGFFRLDLLSSNGHLLKTYEISADNELTIYRGNLKSGKYFLKLYDGETTYSSILVFN